MNTETLPAPYAAYLITQVHTLICLHGRAESCAEIVTAHDPMDVYFVAGAPTYEGAWAMAEHQADRRWAQGQPAVVVCAEDWHGRLSGGTVH